MNGAGVPAVTGNASVFTRGVVTEVPAVRPHVVGLLVVPVGAAGNPVGQMSVTVPLKVSSGTTCSWKVAACPCAIVIWYGAPFEGGGQVNVEVVIHATSKSSATPLTRVVSGGVAPCSSRKKLRSECWRRCPPRKR